MSGALETVAKLAWDTFRLSLGDKTGLLQKVRKIQEAAAALRIDDVGITESQIRKLGPRHIHGCEEIRAPVGFIQIFEDDLLMVAAFMLKESAALPLHNHPTMHGVLKVLRGQVRIKSFDLLEMANDEKVPQFTTSKPAFDKLRKLSFKSEADYSVTSEPCIVTPLEGNIHSVEAVGGPAIFIDFISPCYNPDQGRDCDYFKELDVEPNQQGDVPNRAWVMKIPCPRSYYCVQMDYLGPVIRMED